LYQATKLLHEVWIVSNKRKIKYVEIAEDLMEDIRLGKFRAGEKLYSRSQLVEKYKIGAITAVRVQNYLANSNYVRKVHGGGIFVNYDKDSLPMKLEQRTYPKIKKIIELRLSAYTKDSFPNAFFGTIKKIVSEKKMPYQLHSYTPSEVSANSFNLLPIDYDAGYLVVGVGPMSMIYSISALINPRVHNVLIDSIIPGANCVLTDSFDGMGKLVDYAVESGCKRFIFAKNFAPHLGDIYNEERCYAALYHCRRHGYDCIVVDSGSYDELISAIKTDSVKTAVMFPQDEPACRLKTLIHGAKNIHILITGFDDFTGFETSVSPPTTVRIDQERIVQASIEILCGEHTYRKKIVRIPGHLIVRD
jgi:DNA-binding LacI/PurR family transcriptional regulator